MTTVPQNQVDGSATLNHKNSSQESSKTGKISGSKKDSASSSGDSSKSTIGSDDQVFVNPPPEAGSESDISSSRASSQLSDESHPTAEVLGVIERYLKGFLKALAWHRFARGIQRKVAAHHSESSILDPGRRELREVITNMKIENWVTMATEALRSRTQTDDQALYNQGP